MSLTTYGRNLVAKWLLTTNSAARPTAWYIGVGTGRDAAGLTGEPSGDGYARQQVALTVTGDTGTNDDAETFGPATDAWGDIDSIGLFDAPSAGNCLMVDAIRDSNGDPVTKAITIDDTLVIAAGALDVPFT